jgi:hypothetical protein
MLPDLPVSEQDRYVEGRVPDNRVLHRSTESLPMRFAQVLGDNQLQALSQCFRYTMTEQSLRAFGPMCDRATRVGSDYRMISHSDNLSRKDRI